ncbi:hypothetical protein PIB30_113968, partial [Stylosanthes scabra]|nr:hypothetical protein [Stylosanthes scabra]
MKTLTHNPQLSRMFATSPTLTSQILLGTARKNESQREELRLHNPPSTSNRRPKPCVVVAAASPSPSRWSLRLPCSLRRALACS